MSTTTIGRALVSGVPALRAAFEQISAKAQRSAARKAVNAGLQVMLRAARGGVPHKSIQQSLGSRNRKKRSQSTAEAIVGIGVGPNAKYRKFKRDLKRQGLKLARGEARKTLKALGGRGAPHAHLYALGTAARKTARGANRGASRAHPFLPQAASGAASAVQAAMVAVMRREIEAAAQAAAQVKAANR